MAPSAALAGPVRNFVDDLSSALTDVSAGVAGASTDQARRDVAAEALNLTAAFVDTDERHTDDELWELIGALAPYFESQLGRATPADVRSAGLVRGKRAWLSKPSVLFEILVGADRRSGGQTAHARTYYERALRLGHAVASIDDHPARDELDAIERFRGMLLAAIDTAKVPQPATVEAQAQPATTEPAEPAEPPRPLEELLAELDGLIGLAAVKAEVRLVANLIQVQNLRRQRNLPVAEGTRHLVFTGNPGTGKTTVARLLAQIYRTLAVVPKGHLVETDRSGLVAGYIGQTALKVKQVVEQALGGVLLIDEAHALARGDERDFGQEAIDMLVKLMEDHRDNLVVVAAGYTEEMAHFIESNPGLRSRFPKTIHFPDYTTDELVAIFDSMSKANHYCCEQAALGKVRAWFEAQPRDKGFGNARLARNLFEESVARQATRIVGQKEPTDDQLIALLAEDVPY